MPRVRGGMSPGVRGTTTVRRREEDDGDVGGVDYGGGRSIGGLVGGIGTDAADLRRAAELRYQPPSSAASASEIARWMVNVLHGCTTERKVEAAVALAALEHLVAAIAECSDAQAPLSQLGRLLFAKMSLSPRIAAAGTAAMIQSVTLDHLQWLLDQPAKHAFPCSLTPVVQFVRRLDLHACRSINDDAIPVIALHLPHLRALDLSKTQVTNAAVTHLFVGERILTSSLRSLSLHGNPGITNQCCDMLAQLPLARLNLSRTNITDVGIRMMLGATRSCVLAPNLRRLCLDHLGVTDEIIPTVGRGQNLLSCPMLQHVSLFCTQITSSGVLRLCDSMQRYAKTHSRHRRTPGQKLDAFSAVANVTKGYVRVVKTTRVGARELLTTDRGQTSYPNLASSSADWCTLSLSDIEDDILSRRGDDKWYFPAAEISARGIDGGGLPSLDAALQKELELSLADFVQSKPNFLATPTCPSWPTLVIDPLGSSLSQKPDDPYDFSVTAQRAVDNDDYDGADGAYISPTVAVSSVEKPADLSPRAPAVALPSLQEDVTRHSPTVAAGADVSPHPVAFATPPLEGRLGDAIPETSIPATFSAESMGLSDNIMSDQSSESEGALSLAEVRGSELSLRLVSPTPNQHDISSPGKRKASSPLALWLERPAKAPRVTLSEAAARISPISLRNKPRLKTALSPTSTASGLSRSRQLRNVIAGASQVPSITEW